MKYKLHIAYANREDLTRRAVESMRDIGNIHLWPNNGATDLGIPDTTVHQLPSITAVCAINLMLQESMSDDVMFWAHNDGFCPPGIAKKFLDRAAEKFIEDAKWGVLFSTYDVLCCFNMKMVRDVGYWDPLYHQYVADVDYYRMMQLKGWSEEYYLRDLVEHHGSSTIRADNLFNRRVQSGIGFCRDYYSLKWGGSQGKETFKSPFEGLKL